MIRRGRGSFLLHRRSASAVLGLLVALALICVAYLSVGDSFVSPGRVVAVVFGGGTGADQLIVGTLREPRLVLGLLVGPAFGISGALVQTVARNPLASPDIIGISQGAGVVTVGALTFGVTSYTLLPYLSILGGLTAAALVYVFAWRGGLHATRFVLIGIGFSIALKSVITLLMTKGDVLVAQQAQVWMTGSLNGRGYDEAAPMAIALAVLTPAVLWAAYAQRTVSMDDDTATALGIRLNRVRLGLVLIGVVLASVATGAAGPVDFVALMAPQIARRMTGTAQIPLLTSALTGAVVVVLGDLLAKTLFSPTELPVGVLTAAVGAPYLIWLLIRRSGAGARAAGGK
ncbi:iron chelate uptake ABC transporter family permease subunit [Streptomyces fuscigenes]|nr:iron chelate uptake ABC transporter family permease subunit [Streptomyces fuscigenes]MCF3963882.1 iron chelate uptake ABC transporter family permease subunit [Streptomyces fuscigenes]